MDHAIDFCSYQALVRTALGTIIDVLSAQRLDLMLQCVNLKVKGNNADAFTTIMEEVKAHAHKGRPPAILIRAEAAGGKTTFSKRFVLLCTIEQWGRHVAAPTPDPVFYVPVLVFVVDLVKVLKKQRGADGGNLLLIHLQSHLGAHTRHCEWTRPRRPRSALASRRTRWRLGRLSSPLTIARACARLSRAQTPLCCRRGSTAG
jgi:hypothetical protein